MWRALAQGKAGALFQREAGQPVRRHGRSQQPGTHQQRAKTAGAQRIERRHQRRGQRENQVIGLEYHGQRHQQERRHNPPFASRRKPAQQAVQRPQRKAQPRQIAVQEGRIAHRLHAQHQHQRGSYLHPSVMQAAPGQVYQRAVGGGEKRRVDQALRHIAVPAKDALEKFRVLQISGLKGIGAQVDLVPPQFRRVAPRKLRGGIVQNAGIVDGHGTQHQHPRGAQRKRHAQRDPCQPTQADAALEAHRQPHKHQPPQQHHQVDDHVVPNIENMFSGRLGRVEYAGAQQAVCQQVREHHGQQPRRHAEGRTVKAGQAGRSQLSLFHAFNASHSSAGMRPAP